MRKLLFLLFFLFLFSLLSSRMAPEVVAATTIYVDGQIPANCSGNYSIANRNCTGTDGNAYKTVASGIAALTAGNTLSIRGGTYEVDVMSIGLSSTSVTTIQGYGNEMPLLHKTRMRNPIFKTNGSDNLLIKGISFRGELYLKLTGWTQYATNIWRLPTTYDNTPTRIRFDLTIGNPVGNLASLASNYDWAWENGYTYIYYTSGDPNTAPGIGVNQVDEYDAEGVGGDTGTITVDNCRFENFSHAGVKGDARLMVRNSYFYGIGTTANDHDIYATGNFSPGNEAIIEHNYFGYVVGAAIHLYTSPSYFIVRYNVIYGKEINGTNISYYGILLSGDHNKVYGNTIYGTNDAIMLFRSTSHDNIVENNISMNNVRDLALDWAGYMLSYPTNNTVLYNYFGNSPACPGCLDMTSQGGPNYTTYTAPPNIVNTSNPFIVTSPSSWLDFRLKAGSGAINTGLNLGAGNNMAFDDRSTTWPLATVDQNTYGNWDIGAFAYTGGIQATATPAPPTPTATPFHVPGDTNNDGKVDGIDYVTVILHFGQNTTAGYAAGDLNLDGKVDQSDLNVVILNIH